MDIYKNITAKNRFLSEWHKRLNHIYSDFNLDYDYKILEEYNNLLKVKLTIIKSFCLAHTSTEKITSASINSYLLVIDGSDEKSPDIIIIISQEENPLLYDKYIDTNLSLINTVNFKKIISDNTLFWEYRLKNISSIYDIFSKSLNILPQSRVNSSEFNIKNACSYAERFALVPNPDYINYDKSGGDCTNFVSQILHAGGISYSKLWKPYTNSWLRVGELYNYIISNKLGVKLPDNSPFQKGCMIQFFTPKKGYYFHSGFITHVLPFNEAFYCCHSYNKLNYPLSEIYPVIYPGLRCVALN
ncbi:MAG: amidase domain-containing protein [Clostridium sp.]|nr:amidase domain-containing protein [Clostridium sp.]